MAFRPARASDLEAVLTWVPDAVACATWAGPKVRFPLRLDQLLAAIEFETTHTYVFEEPADLLALGQIRLFDNSRGGNRGHLSRIIVNPAYRDRGIGEAFVRNLIAEAQRLGCHPITLHVVKENATAIRLYERVGFVAPAKQPDHLRPGITYMELMTSQ